nr:MobA/MobL family protein [Fusobacterium nucleatum]
MATYRLCYKKGKVGYSKNHAAYIQREDGYQSKEEDLVYTESGNMNFNGETVSTKKFWEYADTYERVNSVAYRELELIIPNEFNHEQAKELISNFVKKELGEKYPYTYAIHEAKNEKDEKNLHCHLMFSERELDGIDRELSQFFKRANSKNPEKGGAKKNREWQEKSRLLDLRKSWEIETNNLLEKNGFEARVDCRTLKEIRQELLESGMFDKAETYNRLPINVAGKILYKVGHGIELNGDEKQQYDKYIETINRKKELERIYQEKENKKVEHKNLRAEIEKLEKENSKEKAINICSKGEYFRAKKQYYDISKKVKKYSENSILKKEQEKLAKTIKNIEDKSVKSNKYISIFANLEGKRNSTLEILKAKYSEKFKDKYLTKEEEKIKDKYQDYDVLKLKIKLETLSNENPTEKAMNVLTNYEYNLKFVEAFEMQEIKKDIENNYNEAALFNPRQAKNFKLALGMEEQNIENKQEEIIKLIDSVDEKRLNELAEKIEKNNKTVKSIIVELIKEKSSSKSEVDLMKDKVILLDKFSNLEKLYNKEIKNSEKNNKKIFSISSELAAVETLLNSEYKAIDIRDNIAQNNLKAIQEQIIKNNKRILVAENVIDKTKTIISANSKKYNLSGIEIIAIGNLSKGKYWRNYKEIKKITAEIKKDEKILSNMGIVSFGKGVLKKDIELKKKKLEDLEKEEKKIINTYKQDKNFSSEVSKVNAHYNGILKSYQTILIVAKMDNNINYKVKSNIEKPGKQITTYKKNPSKNGSKAVISEGARGLKSNVKSIFDDTEIRATVGIHLEKDKENGWEV